MRDVSYVRDMTKNGHQAAEQQYQIGHWLSEHLGESQVENYWDSYGSTDDLQRLLEDGMNHRFDCVVLQSLSACGQNLKQARYTLQKVFFPCGLHFICVGDGFSSVGKTEEEVSAYFDGGKAKQTGGSRRGRPPSGPEVLLADRVLDGDRLEPLTCEKDRVTGEMRFLPRKGGGARLRPRGIPCDTLERLVLERLREEKRLAECASGHLADCEGELERHLAPLRERAQCVFLETERMLREDCPPLEDTFGGIMDEVQELRRAFSLQNPWVKTYRDLKIGERLTPALVKTAVPAVLVRSPDTVELQNAENRWKEMLPAAWLEG